MKYFTLLLFGILLVSCQSKKEQSNSDEALVKNPVKIAQVDQMDWILGHWKRKNEKEDRETYEKWSKDNASSYSGLGFTLQNSDTIFMENIQLIKLDDKWQFRVSNPGFDDVVSFLETESDSNSISVENQDNEFPKVIKYWKEGDLLMAEISNSELEILFEFEKID